MECCTIVLFCTYFVSIGLQFKTCCGALIKSSFACPYWFLDKLTLACSSFTISMD
jgi:hypothetical protein